MKLLLIDDHPLFRQGLIAALQSLVADTSISEACSVCEALQSNTNSDPFDLILLDIELEVENGLEQLPMLRQRMPGIPVVIISASEDRGPLMQAIEHGAKGYIPKSSTAEVIASAIQLVLSGGIYLPLFSLQSDKLEVSDKVRQSLSNSLLTNRQIDVLKCLAKGLPNKKIAKDLGIAETTVRAHVTDILRALNAENRTEAVYNAMHLSGVSHEIDFT